MEQIIFQQVELIRGRTMEVFNNIMEEQADIQPAGFNNTIRWNLGHILTVQELMAFSFMNEPMALPEDLMKLFVPGSKPSEWESTPPTLEALSNLLQEQTARIKQKLTGRMDEKLAKPFKDFQTVGEVLNYSIYHEGIHTGFLNALRRVVQA